MDMTHPSDLHAQMKVEAHNLRGNLTTLMAINFQLGIPANDTTDTLKASCRTCLDAIKGLADQLDTWAAALEDNPPNIPRATTTTVGAR
jgi:hypothetical protein